MRRGDAVIVALGVGAMLTAACGGKTGTPADAAPTDVAVDQASSPDGGTTCNLATQDCPSNLDKCDFGCLGTTAVLGCTRGTDGGTPGGPCSATAPCARGAGCLTMPDAGTACREYCASDGDCLTGERCHNVSVAVACGGTSTVLALHYCY